MAPIAAAMKLAVALFGLASAAPYDLIAKIPLDNRDVTTDPSTGCPALLTPGQYVGPSLMTQISQKQPDRAFGATNRGVFTPNDIATVISFNVPESHANDTCTMEFIFPKRPQVDRACRNDYIYHGQGSFFFTGFNPGDCATSSTTWNNKPKPGPFPPFPPIHMEPGFRYIIDAGPCSFSAGKCAGGYTTTNDTTFFYTQSTKACPIGLYTAF